MRTPGALAYSFGMLGCDLHCGYCQNWVTSQALRDPAAVAPPLRTSPEDLVRDALRQHARVIVSTYNEPLITSEWAVAVFKEAKAAGLVTGYVSNGNGTPQVLEYLRPWVDLYKVDLEKLRRPPLSRTGRTAATDPGHDPTPARDGLLAGDRHAAHPRLQRRPRRDRAADVVRRGRVARHPVARHRVSRRLQDDRPANTTAEMLLAAADIGRANGLRHVYAGNLPGQGRRPRGTRAARRAATRRLALRLPHPRLPASRPTAAARRAPRRCPGRWSARFDGQITSRPFVPGSRRLTILNP